MTTKEINIQIALGTLPTEEWLKIMGLKFDDEHCFFSNKKDIKIHVKYVDALFRSYSFQWPGITNKELAQRIIDEFYRYVEIEDKKNAAELTLKIGTTKFTIYSNGN